MTSLAQYEKARAALAEATSINEVLPLIEEFELIRFRAQQIRDQALLADATEFQMRAERRLGQVIHDAKAAGLFRQGKPKPSSAEGLPPPTLSEVGVDHKLSHKAQKRASIAEQAFELMVKQRREKIAAELAKPINGQKAVAPGRKQPKDSPDFFPTPPYATRALIERVLPQVGATADCRLQTAWEPACGAGHMAEVLREYFPEVIATDKHEYGYGNAGVDFLTVENLAAADWIITNPPFNDLTEQFVLRGLDLAKVGVAVFVRLQWLETIGRYERLFCDRPPTLIAFFCERVPLCEGRWDPDGGTATAYIWAVWVKGLEPRAPFWIPPGCRESLTREDDRERFTAHPVIKREHVIETAPIDGGGNVIEHDPSTGEIESAGTDQGARGEPAPEPQPSPLAGAGSSIVDDGLDIPDFLDRRKKAEGEVRP